MGRLYHWLVVLVVLGTCDSVEAIAGAEILHSWFPSISVSIYAFCFIVFLSLANFLVPKVFGEFEFWFSLVKVVAIIGFIIIGILAISGIWPLAKNVSGVANLYNNAGFMPHGMGGILAAILITAFSFFGVEIVSIAAAESSNPKQKIRRATNLVLYRIILFFVVSMFIAVSLVDWRSRTYKSTGHSNTF